MLSVNMEARTLGMGSHTGSFDQDFKELDLMTQPQTHHHHYC